MNSEMLMGSEIEARPSGVLYPETEFKAEAESDAEAEPWCQLPPSPISPQQS